tara:strand:- start:704 stop:1369 length:666 start_codon:yes stop_codon:yes gene_type:complete
MLNYFFNNCDSTSNGEFRFFTEKIKPDCKVIFDVGCRDDSLFRNIGEVEVHYFDPNPDSIKSLKESEKNPLAKFNTFGLSNKNETLSYSPANTCFLDNIPADHPFRQIPRFDCEVKKGKDYIIENGINEIDFLKIDVEGFESRVIEGFEEKIKIVKIIQFEYGGTWGPKDQNPPIKMKDVLDYLKENGFSSFEYLGSTENGQITDTTDHYQYCNIVAYNLK